MSEAGKTRAGAAPSAPTDRERDADDVRRDIAQTREELGDTAEALTAKVDVKAQAQQRVQDAKENVRDKRDELLGKAKAAAPDSAGAGARQVRGTAAENPIPVGIAGGFAAGVAIGWLLRGRR
jgi:hypothetical protein